MVRRSEFSMGEIFKQEVRVWVGMSRVFEVVSMRAGSWRTAIWLLRKFGEWEREGEGKIWMVAVAW